MLYWTADLSRTDHYVVFDVWNEKINDEIHVRRTIPETITGTRFASAQIETRKKQLKWKNLNVNEPVTSLGLTFRSWGGNDTSNGYVRWIFQYFNAVHRWYDNSTQNQ